MNKPPSWKIWLVFAGVFAAGAVAGGFLSQRVVDRLVERGRASGQFAPKLVKHFTDKLELTEAQQAEVRVMVDAAWVDMQQQRQASRDTMQVLHEKIFTVLTEEQQLEFREWQERQRKRWQSQGDRRGDGHVCGPDCETHPGGRRKGPPPHPDGPPPPHPPEGR